MTEPLINVGPGGPLEAGLASARHPESVLFWHDGENVAFRNLGVEKAIGPGESQFTTGGAIIRIAQASVSGIRRAYVQDESYKVWRWDEGGIPSLLGVLSAPAQLMPYGSWLVTAQLGLKLWKGTGTLATISDAPPNQNLLIRNNNFLLSAVNYELHWADVRNPEEWTPSRSNTARSLPFRDLDSPIVCLRNLSQSVAVYTRDTCRLVSYNGWGYWFGQRAILDGIGAVGPHSVVQAGFKNFGLSRNGIFTTDGTQFQYIDSPAMHGYLEKNLDWSRANEVFGYHNEPVGEVVWFFPDLNGEWRGLSFKYTNSGFSKFHYDPAIRAAADRDVFDWPLFGTSAGLHYGNQRASATAFVRTKPLDAGQALLFKLWDYFQFVGEWEDAYVKLGFHDEVSAEPEWAYDGPLETAIDHIFRESVFLTIELHCGAEGWFEVSQIMAGGNAGGQKL